MVFAYNVPGICIDVNIERIMKRIFFSKTKSDITKAEVEERFLRSFQENRARDWGNALMDFGSIVCTSARPSCTKCPVHRWCKSRGERPDEKMLHEKKRRSLFLHSNRWWRGRILKALTSNADVEQQDLFQIIDGGNGAEGFDAALEQLRREGLVSGKRRLRIP
jgi:adenine-specific DNA glycosylase